MKKQSILLLFVTLVLSITMQAQTFTEQTSIGFTALYNSRADWGDYNNDGYLDLILCGSTTGSAVDVVTKLYKNNGNNTFTEQASASFIGVQQGALAWGDYDNDGDLDLLLNGGTSSNTIVAKLYRNNGNGTFSELTNTGILDFSGSCAWGDYDNDGLLDLLVSGSSSLGKITKVYKNYGSGQFIDQIDFAMEGTNYGTVQWADINKDGFIDAIVSGSIGFYSSTKIYYNNLGINFTTSNDSIIGTKNGSFDLGDYDNDGDLDLIICGQSTLSYSSSFTKLYKNINGNFVEQTNSVFSEVTNSNVNWGDYDNDGVLDFLIVGNANSSYYAAIYTDSANGIFVEESGIGITGVYGGSSQWVDYDNDGDLDVFVSGYSNPEITKLYKNNSSVSNAPPTVPTNLSSAKAGGLLKLTWNRSADAISSNSTISYNIRVGSLANGQDLNSAESDSATGFRQIVHRGLVTDTFCYIKPPISLGACSLLYFGVQAIDPNYMGSGFASGIDTNQWIVDAGNDEIIYLTDTVQLSVSHNSCGTNTTYSWTPSVGLSNTNIQNPKAFPLSTTTYYATVTSNSSQKTDSVTVFVKSMQVDTSASLTPMSFVKSIWADFDNDGDLDLFQHGDIQNFPQVKLYENNLGSFTELNSSIFVPGMGEDICCADFDNDGKLDIMIMGSIANDRRIRLYHNTGNFIFYEIVNNGLPHISSGTLEPGDFNNDGLPDILISGMDSTSYTATYVYKNNGNNTFTKIDSLHLVGAHSSSAAWGDYNNDGFLDLVVAGSMSTLGQPTIINTKVYKNINGLYFQDINAGLLNLSSPSIRWFDYDSDGDLDILMQGKDSLQIGRTKIYQNFGYDTFKDLTPSNIPDLRSGDISPADYDNDGDVDLFVNGIGVSEGKCMIFIQTGPNYFIEDKANNIPDTWDGEGNWADYDNDGDADLLIAGKTFGASEITEIYKNRIIATNVAPSPPSALAYDSINGHLYWSKTTDDHTPSGSLTYNLAVGKSQNSIEILAPMADLTTGYREIVAMGNQQLDTFAILNLPFDSTYYVRVQAIDDVFLGSAFSSPFQFTMGLLGAVSADTTILCSTDAYLNISIINTDTTGFSYQWSPAVSLSNPNVRNPIASPIQTTWYKVVATSSQGHTFIDSVLVRVGVISFGHDFMANQTDFTAKPYTVQYTNTTTNMGDFDFEWIFGDGMKQLSNNVTITHSYQNTGFYDVSLVAINKTTACADTLVKPKYIKCTAVGIEATEKAEPRISIIPNPNRGNFIIKMNDIDQNIHEVRINSLLGKLLFFDQVNPQELKTGKELNLVNISKGVYVISLVSDTKIYTQKLVIE